MLQGHKDTYHTKASFLKLFIHECLRVYGDRMWDINDRTWLKVNFYIVSSVFYFQYHI